MSRVEIWVEHLNDLARVAQAYQEFFDRSNEPTTPRSDLWFKPGPVAVMIDANYPTEYSIEYSEEMEAVMLVVDTEPETG